MEQAAANDDAEGQSDDSLVGLTHSEPLDSGYEVEAHKKYIKDLFGGLLDASPNVQYFKVAFTWTAPDVCHMTTEPDNSQYQQD